MRNETTVLEKEELRKGDICYLNASTQANWRKGIELNGLLYLRDRCCIVKGKEKFKS